MRKKDERELLKVTLRLYADDVEFIRAAFPQAGMNRAIRHIISLHRRRAEEKAARASPKQDLALEE